MKQLRSFFCPQMKEQADECHKSRLIELSYYDPAAQVRLSVYADTVVLDHNSKGGVISAVRFGGYPEMVRAMSDAIYGGATLEATQNSTTRMLQSNVKGYQRQISHDGVYAVATLMASDDAQTDDRSQKATAMEKWRVKKPCSPASAISFVRRETVTACLKSWTTKRRRH